MSSKRLRAGNLCEVVAITDVAHVCMEDCGVSVASRDVLPFAISPGSMTHAIFSLGRSFLAVASLEYRMSSDVRELRATKSPSPAA